MSLAGIFDVKDFQVLNQKPPPSGPGSRVLTAARVMASKVELEAASSGP